MDDICTKCNGEPNKIISEEEWKDFAPYCREYFKKYDIKRICSPCRGTGLESVRLQWSTDRLDSTKHEFEPWCDEYSSCINCGKNKEEHV